MHLFSASLSRMSMTSIRLRLSGYIQQLQHGTDCTLCLVSRSRLHTASLHCYIRRHGEVLRTGISWFLL